MDKEISILACSMRGLGHEQLAVLAARLAVALQDIADSSAQTNIQYAKAVARLVLDNSGVEVLQS